MKPSTSSSPLSDSRTKIVRKIAGTGVQPPQRPGSAFATRNRFGDTLSPTTQVNKQPLVNPSSTGALGGTTLANPRAGKRFQSGITKGGKVVHFYSDGTRVVLNKKATPTFKRDY